MPFIIAFPTRMSLHGVVSVNLFTSYINKYNKFAYDRSRRFEVTLSSSSVATQMRISGKTII